MGNRALIIAALLLCSTPVSAATIYNDNGGMIIYYELQRLKWEKAGERIAIKGKCYSACTIYLKSRNACVGKRATFGFHKPATGNVKLATEVLMGLYPGWVRAWIRKRGGLSRKMLVMPASYAAKFVKAC